MIVQLLELSYSSGPSPWYHLDALHSKQECIPVGCVPAAHWPYAGVCFPGGCLLRGVSAPRGGVCSWGGVCSQGSLLLGGVCSEGCLLLGVSAPRGVCSGGVSALGGCLLPGGVCSRGCLLWGVSAPGGVYLLQGGLLPEGCGIPACTEADTPPVNRMKYYLGHNFIAAGNKCRVRILPYRSSAPFYSHMDTNEGCGLAPHELSYINRVHYD